MQISTINRVFLKGALSGLKQLLTTQNPLNMMKNAFYFTSKAIFDYFRYFQF